MRKEERLSLLYPYLRLSFSARLSPSLSPAERGKRLVCSYRHAERSYLPRARPFVAFCLAAPRMRIYARVLLPHPRVPRPSSIIRSPWPREAAGAAREKQAAGAPLGGPSLFNGFVLCKLALARPFPAIPFGLLPHSRSSGGPSRSSAITLYYSAATRK